MKSQTDKSNIIDIKILQDYCLGYLSEKQEKKVELICKEHTEVAQELQLLRLSLEKYTGNKKILHRIDLRKIVWEAIQKIWEKDLCN